MLLAATLIVAPTRVSTQSTPPQASPLVIGARSYSPMVENIDVVMPFYARLGLKAPPPEKGKSYPWDEEAWHYALHGAQAPRSQMRFTYATVPGAVPPATALLIEPVEHRGIQRTARALRVQDPGATTLVLLVRDIDAAAMRLPQASRRQVRRVTVYGGTAKAMTLIVPGAHLVELLQLDPLPKTSAPADANVIGAWLRVTVASLDRTLTLYRDKLGLPFKEVPVSNAGFGGLIERASENRNARNVTLRLAAATLPGTGMRLELLEATGVDRQPLAAHIQDPGAARLQLTVRNIEETMAALRSAGSTNVASNGIITQPQYRVAVVSDLNGLFLVLTDRPRR